jgi:TatD DNase family protein
VPHRGKRNEPAFMTATLARLAAVLGRDADEIDAVTTANARTLFVRAQVAPDHAARSRPS